MLKFQKGFNNEDSQETTNDRQEEPIANSPAEGSKKKPRSEKQIEASRRNGARSHGPIDTRTTRYNAIRHGLRAQGLTPWDDAVEYLRVLSDIENKYTSSDPFDITAIRESALEIVRMRRINKLEADNIVAMSSFSESASQPTSDDTPTIHFATMKEYAAPVFDLVNRYKTGAVNRLLGWRRELERIPRDEPSQQSADSAVDDENIAI
jgi:hypothetical protein